MRTETVTVDQLREILAAESRPQPLSFSALVEAKCRRTGNPYKASDLQKLSRVNAFLARYESSVNRERIREDRAADFQAEAAAWGETVALGLRRKGDRYYLACKIERASRPVYLSRTSAGFLSPIAKEKIAAWLIEPKQTDRQEVEKAVIWRTYALDHITCLSMGGRRFRVRHAPRAVPVAPSEATRRAVLGEPIQATNAYWAALRMAQADRDPTGEDRHPFDLDDAGDKR